MTAPLVEGLELHLYVVEVVGHGVKVGVSIKPDKRLAQHRRDATAYGREVGRVWVSEPHKEARANESALKQLAGPGQKREYLPLAFDDVLPAAERLTKTRANQGDLQQQEARRSALFEFLTGGAPE